VVGETVGLKTVGLEAPIEVLAGPHPAAAPRADNGGVVVSGIHFDDTTAKCKPHLASTD
jgi:hypothetical protein